MKNRVFNFFTLFALLVSLVGSLTNVTPVYAAGILVNTAVDEDTNNASCSLREAIIAANTDSAYNGCPAGNGSDAITFFADYTITLSPTYTQLPNVESVITITGNGPANTIIQANDNPNAATYRVLQVNSGGNLTLDKVTVRHGNISGSGGGIFNNSGTLHVTNSLISNNTATSLGGGIAVPSGSLTISNTSFENNSADNGGAIHTFSGSAWSVVNSTFSGNNADTSGGGIYQFSSNLTLTNNTFSGNTAGQGGGLYVSTNISLVTAANNILANNTGNDCFNGGSGTFSSTKNLIETQGGSLCGSAFSIADPQLGAFGYNGGFTPTFALGVSSPAVNNGDNTFCDDNPGPNNLDQRGLTRPQGANCDIGAYESNAQSGPALIVSTAEDSDDGSCDQFVAGISDCTLREAINAANNISGTNSITFAADYTITLASQLPNVTSQMTITGNGAANTIVQASTCNPVTLPGGCSPTSYRVFQVDNTGNLSLDSLTVRHGFDSNGGGIANAGMLTVTNSTLFGNFAINGGGGIFNDDGTLTVTNSTLSGNSTFHGGGIFNDGTLTVTNSTLSGNSATSGGGAIYVNLGTVTVTNSTLSGNSAGGIYNGFGTLNLANTIIANSTADGDCVIDSGTIGTNTNNLIEATGTNACGLTNAVNGNIIGSDPALSGLTGSPAYFPLNTGSPAINKGDNATCTATPVNNQSQNGVTRPVEVNCDIGSYEAPSANPLVSSITRASTSPTSATSVDFNVTFSEAVQNVGVNDFTLTKSSGISGASVSAVSGSGATYTVTVNTGTGSGTLRLDIPVSATIQDLSNNTLEGLPFTSGEMYTKVVSTTFKSSAANDGWILESSETSNAGGSMNSSATNLILGDDAADKQYRAILHFDTSALPDNAVVSTMTLKIKQQGNVTGSSPFSFGSLYVDMRNPAFGGSVLELTDFNFAAKKVKSAIFNPNPVSGWFSARFNNGGNSYVNRTGVSQLRLYFSVDDNNNNIADFIRFFSGNAAAGDRPKLLITYYVP